MRGPMTQGPFHMSAWFAALANVANTDIAPVIDQIFQIQNAHFLMPQDLKIVKAYASAVTLTRARLNSGYLRQTNPLYIRPIGGTLLPANNPNIATYWDSPIFIPENDELILEATDSAAGPNNFYATAWFMANYLPAPSLNKIPLRFTSTTAAVASVWSDLATAFETNLPVGSYTVVGAEVQSTNIIAFRYIFDNQFFRPGDIGISALTNRQFWPNYVSKMGAWGQFTTVSLPRLQVLCNAADAAFEGYLHVVRNA